MMRVQACSEAMLPMASVEKPSSLNHSGAKGLKDPIAAK